MSNGGLHTMRTEGHGTVTWSSPSGTVIATGYVTMFEARIEIVLSEHDQCVKTQPSLEGVVVNYPAASSMIQWHDGEEP